MKRALADIAWDQYNYVEGLRRHFHQHPELRWREDNTLKFIQLEVLRISGSLPEAGKLSLHLGRGGIWFDYIVNNDPDFPFALFRADVDALPVTEETGLPFASQVSGVSHACGHDFAPAMLLGAMKAIFQGLVQPTCNIRFVFQRAEENPGTDPEPRSGGDVLVNDDKVLDGITEAYGLHIWNDTDVRFCQPGNFYCRQGALMGNSGRIMFKIRAKGGHVATPHHGVNALRIANEIINHLDGFGARHIDPLQAHTLEPVILKAGTGSNILAQEAELWFGFRTMLPRCEHLTLMDKMEAEVRQLLVNFPGAELAEVQKIGGHPATINSEDCHLTLKDALSKHGLHLLDHPPILGGEDFAWYLPSCGGVPGCYFFLGARGADSGGDHHSKDFNPLESVMALGVEAWLALATARR